MDKEQIVASLKQKNDELLNKYKSEGNFKQTDIHINIRKMLNFPNAFYVMPPEVAMSILKDLGYSFNDARKTYAELIK